MADDCLSIEVSTKKGNKEGKIELAHRLRQALVSSITKEGYSKINNISTMQKIDKIIFFFMFTPNLFFV